MLAYDVRQPTKGQPTSPTLQAEALTSRGPPPFRYERRTMSYARMMRKTQVYLPSQRTVLPDRRTTPVSP